MKDLREEIAYAIVSSGLVNDEDVEQLAKNIEEDIERFIATDEVASVEQISSDICALYDNGVGANTVEKLMGGLAVQNVDLAKTISEELVYWINHDEKTRRKV